MSRPAVSRRAAGAGVAAAFFLILAGSAGAAPVSPPTSLTATAVSSSQINLTWVDTNPNESAYLVERSLSSTSGFTQVASLAVNATSYASTGLASGTTYYYRVRSTSKNGAYSTYSNVASARTTAVAPTPTPPAGTVPIAPSNLTATAISSSQISLGWADHSTNEIGFRVERSLASAGPWTFIGTTAMTGYGDSGLAAGTLYYYRVQAYNSSGNSAYTNTASATTQGTTGAPSAPANVSATAVSTSQINLAWTDASGNETGFKIERSTSTIPWAQIATVGVNVTSYASASLAASTTYSYRVRSYSASGDSAYSNTASATTSGGSGGSRWSKRFGDVNDDRVHRVAVDGSGNVAITGHFQGVTNFGGGSVASFTHPTMGPTRDAFVAEYSPAGGYLWARTFGDAGLEEGNCVDTDGTGNVLVTGYQGSFAMDLGGGLQAGQGGNDIFIAKYSSAGSWVWSKTLGGYGNDSGNGITADGSGNVIVTGSIDVSSVGVNLGGTTLYSAGFSDVFLAKYSATGAHIWSKRFGGASSEAGAAVATDGAGNIFVTGNFDGAVDFGGGSLTSAGAKDVFVAKFSSAGAHLWSKRFGGTGYDYATGIAVDSAGDVVLTGKFQNSINFGGSSLTSAGGDDAYLAKLSGASGAHIWSKRFGSTSGDNGAAVAVDANNNVAVTGHFLGSVDFGGGALTSTNIDVFAAKYNSAGTHLWSKRFGGAGDQFGAGIGMASTGDVSLAGFFAATVDFGNGILTSLGVYDGFLTALGP